MNVKKTVITAALILTLIPIQHVKALSSEKHGYGQGTATDSQNCPVGAADFNSQYNQYDAYALTNDKKRIILTFDQGYENGYTAPILDVLKEKNVKAIFFLNAGELKEEVMSLHEFVADKYGYEMQYLRPPCGEFSEESLSVCSEMGYKTLMWSFAYVDWKTDDQPDPGQALERIVSSAHGGGIYLLHSVSSTNAAVLGDVIDRLRAEGFIL